MHQYPPEWSRKEKEDCLRKGVIEHRIPEWEYEQNGRKCFCEKCGKEAIVYG